MNDKTKFAPVIAFKQLAENVAKYTDKWATFGSIGMSERGTPRPREPGAKVSGLSVELSA